VEFHDTKAAKELFDVNVFGTLRLTQKLLRESSFTFDKQVMKRVPLHHSPKALHRSHTQLT
jgi:hypothetical protein